MNSDSKQKKKELRRKCIIFSLKLMDLLYKQKNIYTSSIYMQTLISIML